MQDKNSSQMLSLDPAHIVDESVTIRVALARLDFVQLKLCVVVNSDGVLIRTISDGDIRRSLLKGFTLDSLVKELPCCLPVVAPITATNAEVAYLMQKKKISIVILVNKYNRPVGLKSVGDLQEQILLSSPHVGGAEVDYVKKAFETNWIAPAGPNIESFEKRVAEISKRREAVAVSSGTAGLHLALRALNLRGNARIYVSDKTFIASLQPILYEKLTPVLIDSEPKSWNMSPDALERQLARDYVEGHLPSAVIVVHIYGQPAQLDKIEPLARQYGIPIIEDAAESFGASYMGRPSGSHGLISVYSFNGNKIITTSSGGAVVTDDKDLAAYIRFLSTQGREPYEHYQHSQIAYNYRMSNILAGVGLGQLDVLFERVEQRRGIYSLYREALGAFPGIHFQEENINSYGNRWLTAVTLDPDQIKLHPYQLIRGLKQYGIEARPLWKPMHMQPLCNRFEFQAHSDSEVVSSSLYLRGLCLPSGSNLSSAQVDRVISSLLMLIEKGSI